MTPGPTKKDTIVEFFDDPETFNSLQIQQKLDMQKNNLLRLGELVNTYDDEMARSKDFLSKVRFPFINAFHLLKRRFTGLEFRHYRCRGRTDKLRRYGGRKFTWRL